MNSCFENFADEIKNIVSKSRKENYLSLYRIQKSKNYLIEYFNTNLVENFMQNSSGVNLTLISGEGYYITGTTTKVHLTDCIARLYQSLDNLLKANQGHNVYQDTIKRELLDKNTSNSVRFEPLQTEHFQYLHQLIKGLFAAFDANETSKLDISIKVEGNYSICLKGNSIGTSYEEDDFFIRISCTLYLKENNSDSIAVTDIISYDDLINNTVDLSNFIRKVKNYSSLLASAPAQGQDAVSIEPDLIVLESSLAHYVSYRQFRQRMQEADTINYFFDECTENSSWYQPMFTKPPFRTARSIEVTTHENAPHIDGHAANLHELITELRNKLQVKNILYIFGMQENSVSQTSELILAPTSSIYFDESGEHSLHYKFIELNTVDDIIFAGKQDKTIVTLKEYSFPICINGKELAIIQPAHKKVRFV